MSTRMLNLCNQIGYAAWSGLFRRDLLRPTFTIENFNGLRIPSDIKFVILDKDNCFAKPNTTYVWPPFQKRWQKLLAPNDRQYEVCVLSNTAGDASADPSGELARSLEGQVGVRVLRHKRKKPMCYEDLSRGLPCKPEQVLVVGDRLVTDVLMANLMGAKSVYIRPGSHPSRLNYWETYYVRRYL